MLLLSFVCLFDVGFVLFLRVFKKKVGGGGGGVFLACFFLVLNLFLYFFVFVLLGGFQF